MNIVLDIVLSALGFTNTFLHVVGFCILLRRYRRGVKTTQKIYIINLSTFEILLNILGNLQRVPEMFTHSEETTAVITWVQHYATLLNLTGVWIVVYLTMIYITIDRFLVVWLGFKYSIYWTEKKALYLVNVTWALCLLFSISIAIGETFLHFHYQDIFYKYFYPVMDFLYMVIVVTAYVYIFYRYQKSYKLETKVSKRSLTQRQPSSTQQAFLQSRFYTSILLVFTFLIFIVIPDLIYMFFGPTSSNRSHVETSHGYEANLLFDICRFSYAIASSLNFFIYVFLQADVRRILLSKSKSLKSFVSNKLKDSHQTKKMHLDLSVELQTLHIDVDVIRGVQG